MKLRIGIVNDGATDALRRAVAGLPDCEIAWSVRTGVEAVEHAERSPADLVLLDVVLPDLGGAETTRRIMARAPCAILVVTATVSGRLNEVYEAMGHGAVDAVNAPVLSRRGELEGAEPLLAKIALVRRLIPARHATPGGAARRAVRPGRPPTVAIGASTGGPQALVRILSAFPRNFAATVVIVQHVDLAFAAGMASWLRDQSRFPVTLAREGTVPEAGTAYLAATVDHLVLGEDGALAHTPEPRDTPYRPSADALFRSVTALGRPDSIGVLLTGMGRDGAQGLLGMRRAGLATIAQDEATCVVYGMPKAAAELGAAATILPLDRIGDAIAKLVGR